MPPWHDEGCRCCRQLKIIYNSSQYPNQAGQLYSRLRVYQWNEKKRNNFSMQTDLSKQSFSLGIVFVIFSMANSQNAQFLTRRQYTRISNLAGHPKSCVSNQTGKISVLPVTWLLRLSPSWFSWICVTSEWRRVTSMGIPRLVLVNN